MKMIALAALFLSTSYGNASAPNDFGSLQCTTAKVKYETGGYWNVISQTTQVLKLFNDDEGAAVSYGPDVTIDEQKITVHYLHTEMGGLGKYLGRYEITWMNVGDNWPSKATSEVPHGGHMSLSIASRTDNNVRYDMGCYYEGDYAKP